MKEFALGFISGGFVTLIITFGIVLLDVDLREDYDVWDET